MNSPRKIVLITGAASGFGYELVPQYLEAGWTVLATCRNLDSRTKLFHSETNLFPDRLFLYEFDVCSPIDRLNIQKMIEGKFQGKLDCLVNNAGFGLFGALEDLSEEQIRLQMEVNFFGATFVTRMLLPALRKSNGRVILLSSACGFGGLPLTSLYCASKFALEGLSESLYFELAPHGVQVCLVEPGQHKTQFGKNTIWGVGSSKNDSPYKIQTTNYNKLLNERRNVSSPSSKVVKRILQLSNSANMPLRIRCGTDSGLLYFVKKVLPERMAVWVLSFVFGLKFNRGMKDF